jgi:hypothetical protein
MSNKNVIKIINEVISEFDFLGNDGNTKEQENIDLLKNEDLQKQFICDSLLNKKERIKILEVSDSQIGGDWNGEEISEANRLSIKYYLKIQYVYDQQKEPIVFNLDFDGDNISIDISGSYDKGSRDVAPYGESWFSALNWNDINVILSTEDGDKIAFETFRKAPEKIQMLFIREYTADFIGNETGMNIRTKEMNDKVQNVPYC